MPLPWKKAKVTRISRIVADLQPPKRGGSLVVETGFPTSLIDLFVKNRDRLKRPSIKKTKRKKKIDTNENDDTQRVDSVDDLRLADFDPTPAESNNSELEVEDFKAEENPRNSNSSENPNPGTTELVEMRQSTTTEMTRQHDEAPDVFMAVVKVFTVAVLALSTKRLAVGITLSAFVLLFLEFVVKGLVVRLAGGFRRVREQSTESESESEEEFVAPPRERPYPAEEIKALETRSRIKDDEVFLRPELEQLSGDKKWGFLDAKEVATESVDRASALDKGKSKRAKIRRKIIKNFVPKKLRSVSKKKKNSNSNSNLDRVETKIEEQEKYEEFEDAEEMAEEFSGLSVLSEEEEDGEVEEDEEEEEEEEKEEEEDQEKEVKWLLVIIIFGAILLGLCWGRTFAVLLTIVWCVVMKSIGIIGNDEKFPLTEAR